MTDSIMRIKYFIETFEGDPITHDELIRILKIREIEVLEQIQNNLSLISSSLMTMEKPCFDALRQYLEKGIPTPPSPPSPFEIASINPNKETDDPEIEARNEYEKYRNRNNA